jgi:hypothetical protein
LKQLLVNPPVLTLPDFSKNFTIQSDASKKAFGAILSQQTENGEKPIAYASRTTTDSETRYNATELEIAAIAWALNHFNQYINGRKVNIVTDHKPLAALQKRHAPNSRIANLLFKIQQYGSQIELGFDPKKCSNWIEFKNYIRKSPFIRRFKLIVQLNVAK